MPDRDLMTKRDWCDCVSTARTAGDPDMVASHELTCMYGGDPKRAKLRNRCRCWEPPTSADGALTCNEHDDVCGFPTRRCEDDEHRIWIHAACGRPVRMRYCGCRGSDHGYTLDVTRGWWVHYACGWPTRVWFEREGSPPPAGLEGVKPVTYHEYRTVPRTPKRAYGALSEAQRATNDAASGTWVWD